MPYSGDSCLQKVRLQLKSVPEFFFQGVGQNFPSKFIMKLRHGDIVTLYIKKCARKCNIKT